KNNGIALLDNGTQVEAERIKKAAVLAAILQHFAWERGHCGDQGPVFEPASLVIAQGIAPALDRMSKTGTMRADEFFQRPSLPLFEFKFLFVGGSQGAQFVNGSLQSQTQIGQGPVGHVLKRNIPTVGAGVNLRTERL